LPGESVFPKATFVCPAGILPAPVRSKVLAAQLLAPMLAFGIGEIVHPAQFPMQFLAPLGWKLLILSVNLAEP